MNNYEHLVQGGIDALLKWQGYSVWSCQCCVGCDGDGSVSRKHNHTNYGGMSLFCQKKQMEWLEAEYVEPDSIEKIVRELRELYDDIVFEGKPMHPLVFKQVADRLDRLVE